MLALDFVDLDLPLLAASATGDRLGSEVGDSEGGILIAVGLRVGDSEGVRVGSLDRGEMVGDPSGKAGQNVGQALAISSCVCIGKRMEICKLETHTDEW